MKSINTFLESMRLKRKPCRKPGVDGDRTDWKDAELEASFLWTPELAQWIHDTDDAMLLSCTAHIVNCWGWPSWLPPPPFRREATFKTQEGLIAVAFCCMFTDALEGKSERLSPGLSHAVWMSKLYRTKYPDENSPYWGVLGEAESE